MKKFIYFLEESPNYPNELYAKDKNEVVSLLMNDGVERTSIKKIIDVEELEKQKMRQQMPQNGQQMPFQQPPQQSQVLDYDSRVYDNPNEFMNDMMKEALMKANANEAKAHEQAQQKAAASQQEEEQKPKLIALEAAQKPQQASQPQLVVQQPVLETKFFEDNGIKFKLENGKLYKKVWKDVSSGDDPDFRIIKKQTKKLVSKDSFILEHLEWEEI